MAFELLAGHRECFVGENHNRFTYVKVVATLLEGTYKDCQKLVLVNDNLSARKPSVFYEVFERRIWVGLSLCTHPPTAVG